MPEITFQLEDHHLATLDELADVWQCSHDESIRLLLATHGKRMLVTDNHSPVAELYQFESRLNRLERRQTRLIRDNNAVQADHKDEGKELLKRITEAAPDEPDENDPDGRE